MLKDKLPQEGAEITGVRWVEKKNNSRKETQEAQNRKRYKARAVGGEVAEDLFERGLCLPSGTAMTDGDLDRVIETIMNSCKKAQESQR